MLSRRTSISTLSMFAAILCVMVSASASTHRHKAHIRDLNLSVRKVVGGSATVVTGTVTLSEVAATGGDVVTLKSSDSTVASVPTTVTVVAGSKTASFTVTVVQVFKSKEVEINGNLGNDGDDDREAELKVSPFEVKGFLFTPAVIKSGSIFGGFQSTSGTITLGDAAGPAGIAVTITIAGSTQKFPVVTVPAGSKTASFSLTPGSVSTTTIYLFVASVGKSNQSTQLTVTP